MKKNAIYLFANWKMYLDYDESNILANALASEAKNFDKRIKMAIFPSALSFYPVAQVFRDVGIGIGAQNVYWVDKGGYTGEVSANMYKEAGCEYALVGHSERRHLFGESLEETEKKFEAVLAAGLTPVLCVGETSAEKKNGITERVVKNQLESALKKISWPKGKEIIIAYEPVWAIGTGDACDPEEAQKIQEIIKETVKKTVPKAGYVAALYGGSVDGKNIGAFLAKSAIDGVLVGGASAKLKSWLEIIKESVKK
ncbi:MAG: triose-phosphate isomerase [Patescibacteria group bacterium]|nr:triose-phosphate isomerase [Patescibacteria group bacterium]